MRKLILLLLLLALPSWGAVAIVTGQYGAQYFANQSSGSITLTNNIGAGHGVLVGVNFLATSVSISGSTDSFTPVATKYADTNGNFTYMQWFYCASSVGGYKVITATPAAADYFDVFVVEISGQATSSIVDGSQIVADSTGTSFSIGPISTSAADLLVVLTNNSNNFGFTSPGGGFSTLTTAATTNNVLLYKIQSASGSDTATATTDWSWAALMVAFKPAGGAPIVTRGKAVIF